MYDIGDKVIPLAPIPAWRVEGPHYVPEMHPYIGTPGEIIVARNLEGWINVKFPNGRAFWYMTHWLKCDNILEEGLFEI